ncbi:MAG: hypothetical protein WED81_05035 [Rhodothermales bacterium]
MDAFQVGRDFAGLTEDRPDLFDEMAAAVFSFQRTRNEVYRRYCDSLAGTGGEMPFLPAEAFKYGPVTCFAPEEAAHVFESSGTGRGVPARHYVRDLGIYERAVSTGFEHVFGAGPFVIAAHLPHYAERGKKSSLLYMAEHLVRHYGTHGLPESFFLDDPAPLYEAIDFSTRVNSRLILFGAAFGLSDLVERESIDLPEDSIVVETGGMKTLRREVARPELHARLAAGFHLPREQVFSEYGMCELMSQCYTRGSCTYYPPPWMKFRIFDSDDPVREVEPGEPGALALFDLANVYTVSAILTQDRAVRRESGFEVLGRLSTAELRGCNFLLEHV